MASVEEDLGLVDPIRIAPQKPSIEEDLGLVDAMRVAPATQPMGAYGQFRTAMRDNPNWVDTVLPFMKDSYASDVLAEANKGLFEGVDQVLATGPQMRALADQMRGHEEQARAAAESAKGYQAFRSPRKVETITEVFAPDSHVEKAKNFGLYATGAISSQIPILASIVGSSVAGGAMGGPVGAAVGGIGGATVLESGATMSELYGETGKVQVGPSLTAGAIKGALEAIVPLGLARGLGITGRAASGLRKYLMSESGPTGVLGSRIARGVGIGTIEGVTELAQEGIDLITKRYVTDNWDKLSPEDIVRLQESAVQGMLVGSVVGLMVKGGHTKRAEKPIELGEPLPVPEEPSIEDDLGITKEAVSPAVGLAPELEEDFEFPDIYSPNMRYVGDKDLSPVFDSGSLSDEVPDIVDGLPHRDRVKYSKDKDVFSVEDLDQDIVSESVDEELDWEDEYFANLARKGTIFEGAADRKAPLFQGRAVQSKLEKEASSMEKSVRDFESQLISEGKSSVDIAKAIKDKFRFSVTAEDLDEGNVWWREDRSSSYKRVWNSDNLKELKRISDIKMTNPNRARHMSRFIGTNVSTGSIRTAAYRNKILLNTTRIHANPALSKGKYEQVWTEPMLSELLRIWGDGTSNEEKAIHMSRMFKRQITSASVSSAVTRNRDLFRDNRILWNEERKKVLASDEVRALSAKDASKLLSNKFGIDLSWIAVAKARTKFGLAYKKGEAVALRNRLKRDDITTKDDVGNLSVKNSSEHQIDDIFKKEFDSIVGRLPKGVSVLEDQIFDDDGTVGNVDLDTGIIRIAKFAHANRHRKNAILTHEEIHILKEVGFFSTSEWSILVEASKKTKHLNAGRVADIKKSYRKGEQEEEFVTFMAQQRYNRNKSYGKKVNSLLDRIWEFLERFRNALIARGYKSVEDIFRRIETGEGSKYTFTPSSNISDSTRIAEARDFKTTVNVGNVATFGSATQTLAKLGARGDTKQEKVWKINPNDVESSDITAELSSLEGVRNDPSRIYGVTSNNESLTKGVRKLHEAITLYEESLQVPIGSSSSQLLASRASSSYREALQLGIRVRPATNGGFLVLNAHKYKDRMISIEAERFNHTLATGNSLTAGSLFNRGMSEEKHPFSIDLDKVPIDAISALPDGDTFTSARNELGELSIEEAERMGVVFLDLSKRDEALELLNNVLRVTSNIDMISKTKDGSVLINSLFRRGLRFGVQWDTNNVVVLRDLDSSHVVSAQNALTKSLSTSEHMLDPLSPLLFKSGELAVSPSRPLFFFAKNETYYNIESKTRQLIVNTIKSIQKEFGLKIPIGVELLAEPVKGAQAQIAVFASNGDEDVFHIIMFDPFSLDEGELVSSIVHEMGHAIIAEKLSTISKEGLYDLWNSYERWYQGNMFESAFSAITRFQGLDRTVNMREEKWNKTGANGFDLLSKSPKVFSFEEFLAEGISKSLTIPSSSSAIRSLAHTFKDYEDRVESLLGSRVKDVLEISNFLKQLSNDARIGALVEARHESLPKGELQDTVMSPVTRRGGTAKRGKVLERVSLKGIFGSSPAVAADRFDWMYDKLYTIQQVSYLNPHIKELTRFVDLTRVWQNERLTIMSQADATIRQWRALGREQADNVGKFLYAMDVFGEMNKRWPRQDELRRLIQNSRITKAGFDVYVQIRDDFRNTLSSFEDAWIANASRRIKDPIELRAATVKIRTEVAKINSKPYFPHMRFGDFTVEVRDQGGKMVAFLTFETKRDRKEALVEVKLRFPGHVLTEGKLPKQVYPFKGLPSFVLESLIKSSALSHMQEDALRKMALAYAPSQSIMQHFRKRKFTPGYSRDGQRSYARYFVGAATYVARAKHQDAMWKSVYDLRRNGRNSLINSTTRSEIADYVESHLQEMMNPSPEWAWVSGLAFNWYLAFSPKVALVNLLQVPMVSVPYMTSKLGTFGSTLEITKAYASAAKLIRQHYTTQGTFGTNANLALNRALLLATKENVIDQSLAKELISGASTPSLSRSLAGSSLWKGAQYFAQIGAAPFAFTEKYNRWVTFVAAFQQALKAKNSPYLMELEKNKGEELLLLMSPPHSFSYEEARAYLAAKDVVYASQFDYSKSFRPKFMRGRAGSAFVFFMFMQQMTFFARYMPGNVRFLMILLLLGGLEGLPGMKNAFELVKFVAQKLFGKDFNPEREVREFYMDMFGDNSANGADVILHGLSRRSIGYAPFLPNLDISGSVGLGQVMPGLNNVDLTSGTFTENVGEMGISGLGAGAGIAFNMMRAIGDSDLEMHDWKRWERAMPTQARNLSKARRFAVEGRERTRSGATVETFDINDPIEASEIIATALGFTPTKLTRHYDMINLQRDRVNFYTGSRKYLMLTWKTSHVRRDKDSELEAQKAIREWNAALPKEFSSIRITSDSLRRSLQGTLRANRAYERDEAVQRMYKPISKSIRRLFPDSQPLEVVPRTP